MARIHKITMYVVDANDSYEYADDLVEDMLYRTESILAAPPETETREFEWDDDVVVNNRDCTREQCEEFYSRIGGVPDNEQSSDVVS